MRGFLRECVPALPRVVWLVQLGNVVNFFGYGLVLPFELIYLHDKRGFPLPTSGLIVSTIMAVNVVCAGPAGSLADRFGGKRLLFLGAALSGLGYGSLAFVTAPWQGFLASAVVGVGGGVSGPAAGALMTALTTREERVAGFTVARIAINLGIGAGGLVAGAIVAGGSLHSFQLLYLGNGATFFAYLCFLAFVPNARPAAHGAGGPRGYRFVLADRLFLSVLAANFAFVVVGYTLFGFAMPVFARHEAHVGPQAIGAIFAVNTIFIILAQLPVARLARGRSRRVLLAVMCGAWAAACVVSLAAGWLSPTAAIVVLAAAGIAFGAGECLHAVTVQPWVAEIAPPTLVGRYMALNGMSFSIGLAGGPTFSASALAVAPAVPWLAGAAVMAMFIPLLLGLRRAPRAAAASAAPSASSSAA